ncbi:hypothetical protein pb186bvf_020882 [Paramecium bursaria]
MCQFVNQMEILQQDRPIFSSSQRVLIVIDWCSNRSGQDIIRVRHNILQLLLNTSQKPKT